MWQMDGMSLEDLVPVPQKQPGRHFSGGYHVIGHVTPSYDAKYANMAYGDHYRQKVIKDIQRERHRFEEILLKQRRQEAAKKEALSALRARPRYDLNELRHNQRRCAALLFGARQKGAHDIPLLVRWAPRRRESYYLMSERIYNDRLLMRIREQEEEERRRMLASPINFDFADNLVDTSHLYDFQKLVQKTSKDLKGMKFDTQYKDYIFDFTEEDRKRFESEVGRVDLSPSKDEETNSVAAQSTMSKQKVSFIEKSSAYDSDGGESRTTRRDGDKKSRRSILKQRLASRTSRVDMEDIQVSLSDGGTSEEFTSGAEGGDEEERLNGLLTTLSLKGSTKQNSEERTSKRSRRKGLILFDSDVNMSSLNSRGDASSFHSQDEGVESSSGDELSDARGVHNNNYCKHSPDSLKKRAQGYYKKLPRLLKTSELREKVAQLRKAKPKLKPVGPFVTHKCMEPHKTAYERALALVRGRSLPSNSEDLLHNTTRLTFSYFPGMPGTESRTFRGKNGKIKKLSRDGPKPFGRTGIFGEIDVNNFYREEDELIYYIKQDELRVVVESSADGRDDEGDEEGSNDDDDDDDDQATMAGDTVTRATSESYTIHMQSSMGTDGGSHMS